MTTPHAERLATAVSAYQANQTAVVAPALQPEPQDGIVANTLLLLKQVALVVVAVVTLVATVLWYRVLRPLIIVVGVLCWTYLIINLLRSIFGGHHEVDTRTSSQRALEGWTS